MQVGLHALGIARATGPECAVEPWDVDVAGEPAVIEGVRGSWRVDPAYLAQPFAGRTALLSPFDRLIHDRRRLRENWRVFQHRHVGDWRLRDGGWLRRDRRLRSLPATALLRGNSTRAGMKETSFSAIAFVGSQLASARISSAWTNRSSSWRSRFSSSTFSEKGRCDTLPTPARASASSR